MEEKKMSPQEARDKLIKLLAFRTMEDIVIEIEQVKTISSKLLGEEYQIAKERLNNLTAFHKAIYHCLVDSGLHKNEGENNINKSKNLLE